MKLVPVYTARPRKRSRARRNPAGETAAHGRRVRRAEYETATGSITAAARVALDETKIAKVQTKLEGWIDQVSVDFTAAGQEGRPAADHLQSGGLATSRNTCWREGAARDAGQPVHEMLGSTETWWRRRRNASNFGTSAMRNRRNLAHWANLKSLTLYSPISGFVMERNAFPSQRVTPETVLYTVADLRRCG